jgi:DNA polymerase-1
MADSIYIIDGMGFAFRSYFAIRTALTDTHGRPTNAIYGFARVLLKILREQTPSHVVVVFDAPGKTFRDDLYPAYKATRPDAPEDLKEQIPRMYDLVKALNLPLLVVPGVEADDVMGTLARQAEAAGLEAVLVTGDKDMLQLVSDRVKVFDPSKGDAGLWSGHREVVERFGVGPEKVIDALALIGDTADNVPGVRGIGDKTAKKLMEQYGSLENLYAHLSELKGKQKENLETDRAQAFFSRELLTIKTDVPLTVSIEDCRRREPERQTLMEALSELAFTSLMDEALPEAAAPAIAQQYSLLLTEEQFRAAIEEMRAAGIFAVDTETTSIDPMRADLVGLSMSCREGVAYYVPLGHRPDALTVFRDPDDLMSAEQLLPLPKARALTLLKPLLEDARIGKVGHNIKYDLLVLERAGIALSGIVMDTMVASYLTDPSRLRHNLDEVSLQYLRHKPIPISELIGSGSKAITFDQVPVDRACEYACEDADLAWRLYQVFRVQLRERQLESLFEEVELPLIHVLARMEQVGIAIDRRVFEGLQRELEKRLGEVEAEIFESAGERFNINSPKQLQGILFDKLGLKPQRKTKTGSSTDVEVLEQLSEKHPLPAKILEYRTLEKLRSTYVEALPKLVHPETGRIHTSFNQAVAATGRLSSSDPNLQNIPVRTEYGRRIREGFVPGAPGLRLISADYSQIELRILAHLSGDQNLRAAFERDADIHRDTAAHIFGVLPELVTPDMRRQAKAVNFGVVYGISAFGLARNTGLSNAEAARFIDEYFRQYPGVRVWLTKTIDQACADGFVTTLLNRRRYLPELGSADNNVRRAAERMAINTPVQGSAADIIKLAMVRLDVALESAGARLLLQVHDELVAEAPEEKAAEAAGLIKDIMENAVLLDVPLKVDVGIGRNWAEIH